jgi:tRNA(Ile2) C34 agmatinyltransferase TiaS
LARSIARSSSLFVHLLNSSLSPIRPVYAEVVIEDTLEERDDRPPICPACGVTQGMKETGGDGVEFVCLECGFSDGRSD